MATVTFVPKHVPAPACYPADYNALLDGLTTGGGITGTIPDNSGGGIYVGSTPPSSSLTNKVWYKTDAAGRPLGVFMFYNGNWRKIYTGAALGEIRMAWYYSGLFDGTGRGNVGGDYDGWAICNGQNGTPNLEAFIPVGGIIGESVGQASGVWVTDLDGVWKHNGGAKGLPVLNARQLPKLSTAVYGLAVTSPGVPEVYEPVAPAAGGLIAYWPVVDSVGNPVDGTNQQPIPIPQFMAMGFIMFVGYL